MSKNKNIIIGTILAVFLVVAVLLGYLAYTFIYIPTQIAQSHNKNIEVYNTNLNKTKSVFDRISQNLKADPTMDVLNNQNALIKELEELSEQTKNSIGTLDEGDNQDTKNFKATVETALNGDIKTLETVTSSLKKINCLLDKTLSVQAKFAEAQNALAGVNENSENQELVTASKNSAARVDAALEPFGQIETCLDGDLSSFRNPDLKNAIQSDISLFKKFSDALKNLGTGVETNNLSIVEKASGEIQEVARTALKTFDNTSLKGAFDYTASQIEKLNMESENQNAKVRQASSELKQKYQLSDTK